MKEMTLDPRVDEMFKRRPAHERFLALCAQTILKETGEFDGVMDGLLIKDKDDWSAIIASTKRPLVHYNGKTLDEIKREVKGDPLKLAEIKAAFAAIGRKIPQGPGVQQPPDPLLMRKIRCVAGSEKRS